MASTGPTRLVATTLRLPEDKHRRLRIALAERGVTMQRALGEAIEMWLAAADKQRRRKAFRAAKLRGFLADTGIDEMRVRLRKEEFEADARRARATK